MFFKSVDELNQFFASKRDGKKLVFTNGCFDILHIGHVKYLQEAQACGDFLVVGVNSDSSVSQLKGPNRPIQNEVDRSEILAALKVVDGTVIFDEETPIELIRSIKPDVLVKGGDWAIDQIVGSDFVLSQGGEVKSLQFVDGRSTTNVVDKIKSQED